MPPTHKDDPEARIEEMIHDLAYARVQHSPLFDSLPSNTVIDAKANELAEQIKEVVGRWVKDEVKKVKEGN